MPSNSVACELVMSCSYANKMHLQDIQNLPLSWRVDGIDMEGQKRHYSMHTSLFLYFGNFILFCKLCHYIMWIVVWKQLRMHTDELQIIQSNLEIENSTNSFIKWHSIHSKQKVDALNIGGNSPLLSMLDILTPEGALSFIIYRVSLIR